MTGLTGLGHRIRALSPRPAQAGDLGARFEAWHPGVPVTWVPVPVASSELVAGSRDTRYRRAEDAGVQAALPRLVAADRRPDVIVVGRESIAAEVTPIARRHGIPTAGLVQGGRTLNRLGDADALARRQRVRLGQLDVVIAVAHHLSQALAPLSLRRLTVIPNPVDLERFAPGDKPPGLLGRHGIRPDELVVAHVSNLAPMKRPMDVVESAARTLAARRDVVYLIVGDGPYRAPLEARCRELGITRRVRCVGWVEHAEVAAYLRLADVVVMPSDTEGLPLVHLETQASGRLLVASDIPATRELVVHGRTGLIARRGDVEDLAAKTLRGLNDATLRAAIGRAGRATVRAHATPVVLARYVRLIEELATRGVPAASPRRGVRAPGPSRPGRRPGPAPRWPRRLAGG